MRGVIPGIVISFGPLPNNSEAPKRFLELVRPQENPGQKSQAHLFPSIGSTHEMNARVLQCQYVTGMEKRLTTGALASGARDTVPKGRARYTRDGLFRAEKSR